MILAEFEKLVQTPADVERLNEAILELAVHGRLNTQDPADEPAVELLQRIRAEKARREAAGELRKSEPLARVTAEEMPFALPDGWVWTRLGDIAETEMGQSPPGNSYNESGEGVPLINGPVEFSSGPFGETVKTKFTTAPTKMCKKGALLVCVRGSTTGRTNIAGFDACIGRGVAALRAYIFQDYLNRFVLAMRQMIYSRGKGSTFPNISQEQLRAIPFPLPPLAEQKRIVARVDSLLARTASLKESLAAAQAERETLAAASLHRWETGADAAQSAAAWALIRENFAAMIDTPQSVAALKQTILQLAVQGKLVAQDAADGPASALLSRIRAEKARREAAGELRKSEPLPKVKAEEMPFPLPAGWVWAKLGDAVIELQTGPFGSTLHKADYVTNGIPIVNPVNIQDGQIRVLEEMTVDARTRDRLQRYVLGRGDIVMGRRGEMGRCAAITEREAGWLCGSGSFAIKNSAEIDPEYLVRVIRSPSARQYLAGDSVGATMNNLNHRVLANLILGLPPLAEQQRIVAQVDALFALCDGLATGLADGEALRARWVAAALAGV